MPGFHLDPRSLVASCFHCRLWCPSLREVDRAAYPVCREDVSVPRRVHGPRHRSLEGDRGDRPRCNLIDLKIEHVAGEDELTLSGEGNAQDHGAIEA